MVIVPVRASPVFSAIVTLTLPLPVPDAAPAIVSHGALLAAVHEQLVPVVTLTVSLAPPAHTEWLPGEIE
jgi:hypothetical protein